MRPERAGPADPDGRAVTDRKKNHDDRIEAGNPRSPILRCTLILKATFWLCNYTPDDPRNNLWIAMRRRGNAHWYRQAGILLALGNEGFAVPWLREWRQDCWQSPGTRGPERYLLRGRGCLLPVAPEKYIPYRMPPWENRAVTRRSVPRPVAASLTWGSANIRDQAHEMGRRLRAALEHRDILERRDCVPILWSVHQALGAPAGQATYAMSTGVAARPVAVEEYSEP